MTLKSNEKPVQLAAAHEQDEIDRMMLAWANTYPDKPVDKVETELSLDDQSMAIKPIQSARVISRYICGGYKGEYAFSLTYRLRPGNSDDRRLMALEMLNDFGDWAMSQHPYIGEGLRVLRIEPTNRATQLARYKDGDEDYQILLKMTYERM